MRSHSAFSSAGLVFQERVRTCQKTACPPGSHGREDLFLHIRRAEATPRRIKRIGVWGDWDRPYLTLEPEYEAAQIGVFGQMFLKGYIYRGRKPVTGDCAA